MKCGCCGEEVYSHGPCQVHDCKNSAAYEGWYNSKDFAGVPTGMMKLIRVCEDHRIVLIGAQPKQ